MIEYKTAVYFPSLGVVPTLVTVYEQVSGGYATSRGIVSGAHLFHEDSIGQANGLHASYVDFKNRMNNMYDLLGRVSLAELNKS